MAARLHAPDKNANAVVKRIESHRFKNEEGDEYEASAFGGFPEYFRRKKIKLQNLDAELRSSAADNPPIFRGIVAHVNGYTQPSLNDLHRLVVTHGGGFMQYLDGKTTVTHIIASNLTPKKKVEFRRYRIVKPAWIVDSVKAGRLLSWDNYRVVDEGESQKVIALDHGKVTSQANLGQRGYRDQTDTSWYTDQLKTAGGRSSATDKGDLSIRHEAYQESQEISKSKAYASQPARNTIPDDVRQAPIDDPLDGSDSIASDNEEENAQGKTVRQHDNAIKQDTDHSPEEAAHSPLLESLKSEDRSAQIDAAPPRGSHDLQGPTAQQSEGKLKRNAPAEFESPSKKRKLTAEEHNSVLLSDPRMWKSSVLNPDFLKQYYSESRLHHLSNWKANLKSEMQQLAKEKSSSQSTTRKRKPGARRYILHVDFDSFFAAVSLRAAPHLKEKPVVVAHGSGSGSEIASCNYPARKFGIKNGMWMKKAQEMCLELKVLPYDFKAYEEASRHFYEAILETKGTIQSVSVDEALVDISELCIEAGGTDGRGVHEGSIWREQSRADGIARGLRDDIMKRTECAVSVGIGGNILLAKVALRKAKPAGQYHLKPEETLDFIGNLAVQDLPGVAYSIGGKLEDIGVRFVKDIRELSRERLMGVLGPKTGEKIWDYSRGMDRTEVGEQVVRKSVSAEVNWGVRFENQTQSEEFIHSLCGELHRRLVEQKVKGRHLTMKIMKRAQDAPLDPPKHLGHGKCDVYNKSVVLGVATNSHEVISREALSIVRGHGFSPGELRGLGVQMTKLEPTKEISQGQSDSSQKKLAFKATETTRTEAQTEDDPIVDDTSPLKKDEVSPAASRALPNFTDPEVKPLNTLGTQFVLPTQIDPSVLDELPEDIRSRLLSMRNAGSMTSDALKRATSPPENQTLHSYLPSESQLDPEALAALPDSIRDEILASYNQPETSNAMRNGQKLLPQSPRKARALASNASKKLSTTPKKKQRAGLFSKISSKVDPREPTLTQANFVSRPRREDSPTRNESDNDQLGAGEIEPDFLDALPEEIRREVLAEQKRQHLQTASNLMLPAQPAAAKRHARDVHSPVDGTLQRRIQLPPRAPKPSFTTRKLTSKTELRGVVREWYDEFEKDGPFDEDVKALAKYLGRIVLEERDMAKAVATTRWLGIIVGVKDDRAHAQTAEDARQSWTEALRLCQNSVQNAVRERGLGDVTFD